MTRMILMLGFACFLSSCQTGDPIWSAESSRLEMTRQATGFLRTVPGAERRSTVIAQREDLSEDALRVLQRTRTHKQSHSRCRTDSYWTKTLTVFDIHGGSKTYHTEEFACSKDENFLIITNDDFEAIAKQVKAESDQAKPIK